MSQAPSKGGLTCGVADGLWHATDVSIPCTAVDTAVGLANPADASCNLTASVPAGTETATAATETPYFWAMLQSDSPLCTTCWPLFCAGAGFAAASAASASSLRRCSSAAASASSTWRWRSASADLSVSAVL